MEWFEIGKHVWFTVSKAQACKNRISLEVLRQYGSSFTMKYKGHIEYLEDLKTSTAVGCYADFLRKHELAFTDKRVQNR